MKKLAIAAAAVAALTAGTAAHAYTMGTFSNGFVVPNVIHKGASYSTAVGLINQSGAPVGVHWTFFDQDSNHVTDNCFVMTDRDYEGFVWANQSGLGLENKRGYLVFAATASTTCGGSKALSTTAAISGHAFEYDLAAKDVAYVPVIDGPLTTNGDALNVLGPRSLISVAGAVTASGSAKLFMRYYMDGKTGGDDTRIVVWSTGSHKGSYTVDMLNDKQSPKSVNFTLTQTELDFIDPETIVGRPADFLDGFLEWTPVLTNEATSVSTASVGSVFSYSVISAPAFGAVQTILNPAK